MTTTGALLEQCAARLRPFERPAMGRTGCGVSIAAMALALGLWRVDGSWGAGFRFVVVCGLAAVLIFFAAAAALEQVRARVVWRTLRRHMKETGTDLDALRRSAEARAGRVPGGRRLAALLKDPPGGPAAP